MQADGRSDTKAVATSDERGPEPNVDFFPNVKRLGVKRVAPPSPPGHARYIDLTAEDEAIEDIDEEALKDEASVLSELEKLGDAAVMKKLDIILDRKFSGIFQRLKALEKRQEAIMLLIKRGVDANDGFWEFENPRYLKPLNRYYGMIDMIYSMVMEAVDFNKGILRKKPKKE